MVIPTVPSVHLCSNLLPCPPKAQETVLETCDYMDLGCRPQTQFGPKTTDGNSLLFHSAHCHCPMSLEDTQAHALASAQAEEVDDEATLVLLLCSTLLKQAQELLALGVKVEEIQQGYRLACVNALELLEGGTLVCSVLGDPRSEREVATALRHYLCRWEPELGELLGETVMHFCVQSWTSGQQGMRFDPCSLKVNKVVGDACMVAGSEKRNGMTRERESDKEEKMKKKHMDKAEEVKENNEGEAEKPSEQRGSAARDEVSEKKKECSSKDILEKEREIEAGNEEQLKKQSGMEESKRGGGKTGEKDKPNELTIAKGESEDEWEEWEDLSLEIDEVKTGGDEEVEEVRRKNEDKGEQSTVGDSQEREKEKSKKERLKWKKRELKKNRLYKGNFRLGLYYSSPPRITALYNSQRTKRHKAKGKLTRPARGRSLNQQTSLNREPDPFDRNATIQVSTSTHDSDNTSIAVTVTLSGSDPDILDRAERVIHCSLTFYRDLLGDPRMVPGAGITEVVLANQLTQRGLALEGMEQLVVHAFAQSLLEPVRALGENWGIPGDSFVLSLYETQVWRRRTEGWEGYMGVAEPLAWKRNALKHATEAALNVLSQPLSQTPEENTHTH